MSQQRPSGAVRKPRQKVAASAEAKRPIRWAYYASVVLVLALLVAVVQFGRQPLLEAVDRPVAKVAIEGEFRYLDETKLRASLEPLIDRSFLQLNLKTIKEELESQAWVARVVLTRNWPDTLSVRIYEELPIARWDDYGFLSAQGEVIEAERASELLADLPMLRGPKEAAPLVMNSYKRLNQLLSPYDMALTEVSADERMSWRLRLDNGWLLELGRDDVIAKVQRLLRVYERTLKDKVDRIAAVDLRYENGFSVNWREPINELAAAPAN